MHCGPGLFEVSGVSATATDTDPWPQRAFKWGGGQQRENV